MASAFGSTEATEDEYDSFEDIENEEIFEDEVDGLRPKRQEQTEDENTWTLRFLQKELRFWNKLSEIL